MRPADSGEEAVRRRREGDEDDIEPLLSLLFTLKPASELCCLAGVQHRGRFPVLYHSGAVCSSSGAVRPKPLPPEVTHTTMFFPEKSEASKKELIMRGATYHHTGKPK